MNLLRLSETKKAEYQEMAQAQKEKLLAQRIFKHCPAPRFQVAFAEYKTTQDFKAEEEMRRRHIISGLPAEEG